MFCADSHLCRLDFSCSKPEVPACEKSMAPATPPVLSRPCHHPISSVLPQCTLWPPCSCRELPLSSSCTIPALQPAGRAPRNTRLHLVSRSPHASMLRCAVLCSVMPALSCCSRCQTSALQCTVSVLPRASTAITKVTSMLACWCTDKCALQCIVLILQCSTLPAASQRA